MIIFILSHSNSRVRLFLPLHKVVLLDNFLCELEAHVRVLKNVLASL